MMRKAIFDSGLRYNEKYRTSQDIALWFDVLANGYKIGNIAEVALYARQDKTFYSRRGKNKAKNEFEIYMKGIYRLFGPFTWKYIYPIMRYAFRLMPQTIINRVYVSSFRRYLLQEN